MEMKMEEKSGMKAAEEQTVKAKEYFDSVFARKEIPDEVPEILVDWENDTLYDIAGLLVEHGLVQSKKEFWRLLKQGGVQLNGERLGEGDEKAVLVCQDVLKIGKKRFVRIVK
ncbi:MAG: hypothetical protein Q4E24_05675 [bacterium]|nr:hypothetical protein [bacterium]